MFMLSIVWRTPCGWLQVLVLDKFTAADVLREVRACVEQPAGCNSRSSSQSCPWSARLAGVLPTP